MKRKSLAFTAVALAGAAALAGCESIGDGNTLQTLELRPGDGTTVAAGAAYPLHECIRDQLALIGTFTDGTAADFSFRARWSSSDPAVVDVSNGDIASPAVVSGLFATLSAVPLRPGTVIPKAVTASGPVTITAEYLGRRATLNVTVATPSFQISPAPGTALAPATPVDLGAGTAQRFNLIVNRNGRRELASALNQLAPINPVLWRFTPGSGVAFDARDSSNAADFDKYTYSNGAGEVIASISVATGTVTGHMADPATLPVEAHLSLCSSVGGDTATDPAFVAANPAELKPTIAARVTGFDADALTIAHEDGFSGDLAQHTNELLKATLTLDSGATQDLSTQARFEIEPKNAACDAEGLHCLLNEDLTFAASSNDLRTVSDTAGGSARARACFPFCAPTLASLAFADPADAAGTAPHTVDLTASAVALPALAAPQFQFDCGDAGATLAHASATSASASCTYPNPGFYTPTVRVRDSDGVLLSQNAGAVQVVVGGPAAGNTPPTAALTALPLSGDAPLLVTFSAVLSGDPNAGDEVTVYEFDFGDGVVVRQSTPSVSHVYLAAPATAPTVTAVDKSGARTTSTGVSLTINGTVPAERFVRSNPLAVAAVPATLTGLNICTPASLDCTTPPTVAEAAFTYPSQQFEAIGSFTATAPATFAGGAATARQKITRFVGWVARPQADPNAFSEIVFLRNFSNDFLRAGQVEYLLNVGTDTPVTIHATPPVAPFATVTAPAPATLTVTPCTGCGP